MKTVIKILTALAAVIGAAYVIATYGDKIVAWSKELLAKLPCRCEVNPDIDFEDEASVDEVAEESAVEEVPTEEAEEAVEEIIIEDNEPVAEENDFAE